MQREPIRLAVVMPVGPGVRIDFAGDTLDSVAHHCVAGRRVIVVDDTGTGAAAPLAERHGAELVPGPGAAGLLGGLHAALSAGFRAALDRDFDLLLRIDTDALVTAPGVEAAAMAHFAAHPGDGCLGAFRRGYDGGLRSRAWARRRILRELTVCAPARPASAQALARLLRAARRHGYRLGESVLGGVCIYSREAIVRLERAGLLGDPRLARMGLSEDHLFGLCLAAVGLGLADFGTHDDDLPMGVRHRGLPASPEELLARGKGLVHSTRGWGGRGEAEVRRAFAEARGAAP